MPLNWMDVSDLPFTALALFERVQLGWMARAMPVESAGARALAVALPANPQTEWVMRHKAPEIGLWLDAVLARPEAGASHSPEEIRAAEVRVLAHYEDWLIYALDPQIYDNLPFLNWDSHELLGMADFRGRVVIDFRPGTGRQTFTAAPLAASVFAVEPSSNLRDYLRQKAKRMGVCNVHVVDGLMTDLPFPDGFADIVMSGHVYGDEPEAELAELLRVTRPGGNVLFCPGNNDVDNEAHAYLVSQGFEWARFEEPTDGMKRKYWRQR